MKENDRITISKKDEYFAFALKNDDRTCEVATKNGGMYRGIIESITSNGRYVVRIAEVLREEQ
jgi:hypothetical protein